MLRGSENSNQIDVFLFQPINFHTPTAPPSKASLSVRETALQRFHRIISGGYRKIDLSVLHVSKPLLTYVDYGFDEKW